jgi:hypothetical protein
MPKSLNPICHLLALLAAHTILHVSRISVKSVHSSCTSTEGRKWTDELGGTNHQSLPATAHESIKYLYQSQRRKVHEDFTLH